VIAKKKKRTAAAKGTAVVLKPPPPRYEALPDLLTPEEAGAFLRTSRNTTYELIRSKALPSIRFGRLIRISKTALMSDAGR
jgi:excisionase family DNA binding protein